MSRPAVATSGRPGSLPSRVYPQWHGQAIDLIPPSHRRGEGQGGAANHQRGSAPLAQGGTRSDPRHTARMRPTAARRRESPTVGALAEGLAVPFNLPESLPTLRMLLVLDNLQGHRTPDLVLWMVEHGIMPVYTPVGGSWLNMAESVQAIHKARAFGHEPPRSREEIIDWIEATARGWNRDPTPFIWGGKRRLRRSRLRDKRHSLGKSGATTRRVIPVRSRHEPNLCMQHK